MKLSVETIAAHQDLLLTSLPDRLAPRWQLLSSIASEQADFKAEDHLTALATLSDQDFAQSLQAKGELEHNQLEAVCIVAFVLTNRMCLCPNTRQCCLIPVCTD